VRWIVATSLRFRYLVIGFAAILIYFGAQTLGHQKIDVFPEFAERGGVAHHGAAGGLAAGRARCL